MPHKSACVLYANATMKQAYRVDFTGFMQLTLTSNTPCFLFHPEPYTNSVYLCSVTIIFQEVVQDAYEGKGRGIFIQVLENVYRFSLGAIAGGTQIS